MGYVNVDKMLEEISSHQLSEWMAFYRIEPFGFAGEMIGHAQTSAVIANTNRRKGARVFEIEDFMPKEHQRSDASSFIENLKMFFRFNKSR